MAKSIENNKSNAILNGTNDNDTIKNQSEVTPIYYQDEDTGEYYWEDNEINSPNNSTIDGGEGNDLIYNDAVEVSINGGAGSDTIENRTSEIAVEEEDYEFAPNNSTLNGGDGNDSILNEGSDVLIYGGAGDDSISNNGSYSTINGGDGNDSILNEGSDVLINGGADDDTIQNNGENVLFTYAAGDGNDLIQGFNDSSTLQITSGTVGHVNSNGTDLFIAIDSATITLEGAFENESLNIVDADGNDIPLNSGEITGTAGDDSINNYFDDMIINALDGNDTIVNEGNNSILLGDEGNDFISNSGENATIAGGTGKNTLTGSGVGVNLFVHSDGADDLINNYNSKEDIIVLTSGKVVESLMSGNDIVLKVASGDNELGTITVKDTNKISTIYDDDYKEKCKEIFREFSNAHVKSALKTFEEDEDIKSILTDGENSAALSDIKEIDADLAKDIADALKTAYNIGNDYVNSLAQSNSSANVTDNSPVSYTVLNNNTELSNDLANLNNLVSFTDYSSGVLVELAELSPQVGKTGTAALKGLSKAAGALSVGLSFGECILNDALLYSENTSNWVAQGSPGDNSIQKLAMIREQNPTVFDNTAKSHIDFACNIGSWVTLGIMGAAGAGAMPVILTASAFVGAGYLLKWAYDEYVAKPLDAEADEFQAKMRDNFAGQIGGNIPGWLNDKGDGLIGTNGDDYVPFDPSRPHRVFTGSGSDTIEATSNDNNGHYINTGDGGDSINSNSTNSTIDGGDGPDNIYTCPNAVNNFIDGGDGPDIINFNGENSTVSGGKGDDTITNGADNSTFQYSPGDGNDVIYGFNDSSTLQIGNGTDTYSKTKRSSNVIVTVGDSNITLAGAGDLEDINIVLGDLPQTVVGDDTDDAADDSVDDAGDDSVDDAGDDTDDEDVLNGSKGKDDFIYNGGKVFITDYQKKDKIDTGTFAYESYSIDDDDLIFDFGDDNSLTIQNGVGKAINMNSTVNFYTADGILDKVKKSITLTSGAESFSAKSYSQLTTIDGSATGAIEILGNNKANKIYAGASGSTLAGGKGKDSLVGGDGADIFLYDKGDGKDVIENYGADDNISLGSDVTIKDTKIKKGNAIFKVKGGALTVNDATTVTLTSDGNETIFSGGVFIDSDSVKVLGAFKGTVDLSDYEVSNVDATLAKKKLTLAGDDSANYLVGGKGKDCLTGGAGNDTLWGGKGKDSLFGGEGDDVFIFQAGNGTDTIFDYASGELLQILNKRGEEGNFKNATFKDDKLTLAIQGGGKVILENVSSSTNFNINGETYHVAENSLVK